MTQWIAKLQETFISSGYWHLLLQGLGNTIIITLGALVIGVVIGSLIAVVKVFSEEVPALRPLDKLCDLYVTVIRGIPVVVLLLVFYYIILKASDGISVGILTFGINSGAYMAELIRSGLNAVDPGQMEAGRSLGMSRGMALKIVVFPQAVRYILPAIGNEFIALLKETSVAGYVAVVDVTRAATLIRNNTYDSVNCLFTLAAIYLILTLGLTRVMKGFENRLSIKQK